MRSSLHPSTCPQREPDQKRDRHGFRGKPPPASFSLAELHDDTQLNEHEVAAIGRWSISTVSSWRRQPDHPLLWDLVAGKYVRYRAGDLKNFMAGSAKRSSRSKPSKRSSSNMLPKRRAGTDHELTAE
jgi:hypothetical protein